MVYGVQSHVVNSLVRRYGVKSQHMNQSQVVGRFGVSSEQELGRYGMNSERPIAVMSMYRAQCDLISNQLQHLSSHVAVSHVLSAHGIHNYTLSLSLCVCVCLSVSSLHTLRPRCVGFQKVVNWFAFEKDMQRK